jgi:hypothetical protein
MQQNIRITLIAAVAIAIGALMIPGTPLAFASHHHHHHHHHNSVKIDQSATQINACDHGASCSNDASNSASVDLPHHSSNHVKISQSIDQANLCDNGADCSNSASNDASVN